MDIVDALKRPEGKTLEFKRDLSSPEGVLRTLAANSNTAGETVLVGVEDATRLVKRVERGLVHEIGISAQDPKRRYFRVGPT